MPWAISEILVACLSAIGIFTTTFSIIEPRPLLAISHQAHAVVDPIWYSIKSRTTIPLVLPPYEEILYQSNHTFRHFSSVDGANATYTYITAKASSSPVVSTPFDSTPELPLESLKDSTVLTNSLALRATQKSHIDYRKIVARCLLRGLNWFHRHQVGALVTTCLCVLCFILLVPITVPTSVPSMSLVKSTRRAAKGPCRNRWSLISTRTHLSWMLCALDQKTVALNETEQALAAIEWHLDVQNFISHARIIAMDAKLLAAQQDAANARAETADVKLAASEYHKLQEKQAFRKLETSTAITQAQISYRDEEHYTDHWVFHVSQYLSHDDHQNKLRISETVKAGLKSKVSILKDSCNNLENTNKALQAQVKQLQNKSAGEGRKAKALQNQILQLDGIVQDLRSQVINSENDASKLATTVRELTANHLMCEEQLKIKTKESKEMEQELQGFKQDLAERMAILNETAQLFNNAKSQVIEAGQRENELNNNFALVNKQVTQLKSELASEKEKLRKSEESASKQQEIAACLEKEVATFKETTEELKEVLQQWIKISGVEDPSLLNLEEVINKAEMAEAALKDAREVKQKLYLSDVENEELRRECNALDKRLELFVKEKTMLHDKINILKAQRDNFLLKADENRQQIREGEESRRLLILHQSERAQAFANLATRPAKRHRSDESTSIESGETSPSTSPDTNSSGHKSVLRRSLNAVATEFTPLLVPTLRPAQRQVSSSTRTATRLNVRPGKVARQVRRPVNEVRIAKFKVRMMASVLSSPRLRLPSGGSFNTAGSSLDVTIWRFGNSTALVVVQRASDSRQSSCALRDFDEMHYQSKVLACQVIYLCDKAGKSILRTGGKMTAQGSVLAENSSKRLPFIGPLEAPHPKSASPSVKKVIQSVSVVPPEAPRPTPEAAVVIKPVTSRWAQQICRYDPNCTNSSCTFGHPQRALRANTTCREFKKGGCRWGAACHFDHSTSKPSQGPQPPPATDASISTFPPVLPSGLRSTDEMILQEQENFRKQVERRAEVLRAANWKLSIHAARVQAQEELANEAEVKARREAAAAEARVESEFQQQVGVYFIKLMVKADEIKRAGRWNMTFDEAEKDAIKVLGDAPTR